MLQYVNGILNWIYWKPCLLAEILTYLLACLFTYLCTYLLTYLLNYLLTYLLMYSHRLFVSASTHSFMPINALPPSHLLEYNLRTFVLGCISPFNAIIFCVCILFLLISCIVQCIMSALSWMTSTTCTFILSYILSIDLIWTVFSTSKIFVLQIFFHSFLSDLFILNFTEVLRPSCVNFFHQITIWQFQFSWMLHSSFLHYQHLTLPARSMPNFIPTSWENICTVFIKEFSSLSFFSYSFRSSINK